MSAPRPGDFSAVWPMLSPWRRRVVHTVLRWMAERPVSTQEKRDVVIGLTSWLAGLAWPRRAW